MMRAEFSCAVAFLVAVMAVYFVQADYPPEFEFSTLNVNVNLCKSSRRDKKADCVGRGQYLKDRCRCERGKNNDGQYSEHVNQYFPYKPKGLSVADFTDHKNGMLWKTPDEFACGLQLGPIMVPRHENASLHRLPFVVYGLKCTEMSRTGRPCVPTGQLKQQTFKIFLWDYSDTNKPMLVQPASVTLSLPTSCAELPKGSDENCGPDKYYVAATKKCQCWPVECGANKVQNEENCRCSDANKKL